MSPNDADGMANSVDPDLGAVWSGSALFAQAYLSENLGSLRYPKIWIKWFYNNRNVYKDTDRMANNVDPDQTAAAFWVYRKFSKYSDT